MEKENVAKIEPVPGSREPLSIILMEVAPTNEEASASFTPLDYSDCCELLAPFFENTYTNTIAEYELSEEQNDLFTEIFEFAQFISCPDNYAQTSHQSITPLHLVEGSNESAPQDATVSSETTLNPSVPSDVYLNREIEELNDFLTRLVGRPYTVNKTIEEELKNIMLAQFTESSHHQSKSSLRLDENSGLPRYSSETVPEKSVAGSNTSSGDMMLVQAVCKVNDTVWNQPLACLEVAHKENTDVLGEKKDEPIQDVSTSRKSIQKPKKRRRSKKQKSKQATEIKKTNKMWESSLPPPRSPIRLRKRSHMRPPLPVSTDHSLEQSYVKQDKRTAAAKYSAISILSQPKSGESIQKKGKAGCSS